MPEQREAHAGYADQRAGQWAAAMPQGPFNDPATGGWGSEGPGGFDGHMQERMKLPNGGILGPAPGAFQPKFPGDFGVNEWLDHERNLGSRFPTEIGGGMFAGRDFSAMGGGPPAWAPAWGIHGGNSPLGSVLGGPGGFHTLGRALHGGAMPLGGGNTGSAIGGAFKGLGGIFGGGHGGGSIGGAAVGVMGGPGSGGGTLADTLRGSGYGGG